MSIEMPAGLQWLSYLAGSSWPKGDEDALFALSQDWTDAANALNAVIAPLRAACDTATGNYSGSGADQMKSQFEQFFSGDSSVEKIVEGLEQLADSVFDCGQQTEYAKLQIIITLAVMAAEIAYALATLWGAWAVPLIEAEGAGIMRLIASRLAGALAARASRLAATPLWKLTAIQVLKQGAIGLGTDALAQGIELSEGHSKGFNVKQMFITGAVGAVSGGVATPIGHFGGKYLGGWVAKNGGMNWWKAGLVAVGSGIPAGVVGAGAGIVTYGALTGNWEFDPAALLGGVGGGLVGGVHGVLGHFQGTFTAGGGRYHPLTTDFTEDKPPAYSDGDSFNDGSSFLSDAKYGDSHTKTSGSNGDSRSQDSPATSPSGQRRGAPATNGTQRSTPLQDNRNDGARNEVPENVTKTHSTAAQGQNARDTRAESNSTTPQSVRERNTDPFQRKDGPRSSVRDEKTNPVARDDEPRSSVQGSNERSSKTNPFRQGERPRSHGSDSESAHRADTPVDNPDRSRYRVTVEDVTDESELGSSSTRTSMDDASRPRAPISQDSTGKSSRIPQSDMPVREQTQDPSRETSGRSDTSNRTSNPGRPSLSRIDDGSRPASRLAAGHKAEPAAKSSAIQPLSNQTRLRSGSSAPERSETIEAVPRHATPASSSSRSAATSRTTESPISREENGSHTIDSPISATDEVRSPLRDSQTDAGEVRGFESLSHAGDFAADRLNTRDDLPIAERDALDGNRDIAMVNDLLRNLPPEEIGNRYAEFSGDHDTARVLTGPDRVAANIPALRDLSIEGLRERQNMLRENRNRTPDDDRELAALDEILSREDPEQLWNKLRDRAALYRLWSDYFEQNLHQPFEPGAIGRNIELLDSATGHELPLPQAIHIDRALTDPGVLVDKNGNPFTGRNTQDLVDTVQRESGYMSLPLRDEPASATGGSYRMQLEIPRGTRGVYVGGDHLDTHHLLLARDTTYRITGVSHEDGATVIAARVEPRPEDPIIKARRDIAESEARAARLRREQTDRITDSRERLEDARKRLDTARADEHAATGEHPVDGEQAAAHAAYEQAAAEHLRTVEDALDKLVASSREAGSVRWDAFLSGRIGRGETFEAVARERVVAARAAADARQEYYEVLAGPGKPSEKSGPLTRLSNGELNERILRGSEHEKNAALNELSRRVTGKVKRFTQDMADLLMEHAPVEVDTGEGKEMLVILRSVRLALDDGLAHVMTSSDPLVDHMQHEFLKLVADRDLNLTIYHLDSDQPFPARAPGDSVIVVGTAQDYGFRAVKEAQAMIDKLTEAGLGGDDLKSLQQSLAEAPTFPEYKALLDEAAAAHGVDARFEPFPGGKLTVDEIDAQLIDEQTHYVLSPGAAEQASPEFVAKTKDVWGNFQRAKDEGVLAEADFGKNPDIPGMFDSRLTPGGREKLEAMLGTSLTPAQAEEYAHAAQAQWGPRENTDYHVGSDGKIKIISSKTNDQLMDDPEKQSSSRWNGFAKYLEVKHSRGGDDSSITADPQYSISITGKQLFSGGHLEIRGTSGTLLTATEHTPRGVEDIMHDEYGTGPIARVERFFDSQLDRLPDQHFTTRDHKFTQMAKDIIDTAFVENPNTGKLEQAGSPQLGVAMDNADVGRLAEAVRAEAESRGLTVELHAVDAAWMDSFGSKRAAYDKLQEIIAEGGKMGKITLGNKVMSRGVDITPVPEAIAAGGLKVKISGGPAYSARVNHQVQTRAARSGDLARGGRENGGTPGEAVHYISPEDYLSSAPTPRVKQLLVRYQDAAQSHSQATELHRTEQTTDSETRLEQTLSDLDTATNNLRTIATPLQKAAVEQQLVNSRRAPTHSAHAPPEIESIDGQPTTPPPRQQDSYDHPDNTAFDNHLRNNHSHDNPLRDNHFRDDLGGDHLSDDETVPRPRAGAAQIDDTNIHNPFAARGPHSHRTHPNQNTNPTANTTHHDTDTDTDTDTDEATNPNETQSNTTTPTKNRPTTPTTHTSDGSTPHRPISNDSPATADALDNARIGMTGSTHAAGYDAAGHTSSTNDSRDNRWVEGGLYSPARPSLPPTGQDPGRSRADTARNVPDIFDRPRTLDELYTSITPLQPDISFDDLQQLREQSYLRNGITPASSSREGLDAFLRGVWDAREFVRTDEDVYYLYSDRGADDPVEDPHEYLHDLVQILTERAPGPAQQADVQHAVAELDGVLTADSADDWMPEDISFLQYTRTHPADETRSQDVGFKVYVNILAPARPLIAARVVHEVVDDPVRFPGIYAAKAAGPATRRVDGIVIYARDQAAADRVTRWLRTVQADHGDLFLWDVPPGSEQVLAGVGIGAELPWESFGALRSQLTASALNLHRDGTFEDFHTEVLTQFRANGIDPDRVHLNLATPPAAPDNNCAPLVLAEIRSRTNSPVISAIDPPTPAGITRAQLENAAGAALQPFGDHTDIAETLRRLGHGHLALVVDAYTSTDTHGIGAHAYLLANEHGDIKVVDPGFGLLHGFPPIPRRELSGSYAITYTPQGYPVTPAPHTVIPAAMPATSLIGSSEQTASDTDDISEPDHTPASELATQDSSHTAAPHRYPGTAPVDTGHGDRGRIGDDGIRRFDTSEAGAAFATHHLRIWDELPDEERSALHRYESDTALIGWVLRRFSDEDLAGDWIELLRDSVRTRDILLGNHGIAGMTRRRNALLDSATPPHTDDIDAELRALNQVLDDPRPFAAWDRIEEDARLYTKLAKRFSTYTDPDAVRDYIARLDRATGRPLPLSEPIVVVRGLDDLDFLAIDEHGATLGSLGQYAPDLDRIVNVPQRDRSYLSTSVRPDTPWPTEYRLELVIPPGTRGVYFGNDANFPIQQELLLARNTPYRITGITVDDDDVTVLHAVVEPGPVTPARPTRTEPTSSKPPRARPAPAPSKLQPGRARASLGFTLPDGTIVEISDGSSTHRAPGTSDERDTTTPGSSTAARASAPIHTSAEQTARCGPLTLDELRRRTNSPVVRPITGHPGPAGITRQDLEHAAGAWLRPFDDHAHIARQLLSLGPGHIALVVDDYATVENGIGAHAYLLTNDNGVITVVDPGFDVTHEFPPQPRRELAATRAILYTPTGHPTHALPNPGAPTTHPDHPLARLEPPTTVGDGPLIGLSGLSEESPHMEPADPDEEEAVDDLAGERFPQLHLDDLGVFDAESHALDIDRLPQFEFGGANLSDSDYEDQIFGEGFGDADDPDWEIDDDGVLGFATDAAGSEYGHRILRIWDEVPEDERTAIHTYEHVSVINDVLKGDLLGDELPGWIDALRETAAVHTLLTAPHDTDPDLTALRARHTDLLARDTRTPDEQRESEELTKILTDPRPAARWEQMQTEADRYQLWDDAYREHFGEGLTPQILRRHLTDLDRATARVIPLTRPIRVIRGMQDAYISALAIDADGTPLGDRDPRLLVGVPQRERGLMSTSVSSGAIEFAADRKYRLELTVPPGTHGIYIGLDGYAPTQQELLLARGTDYRITDVDYDSDEGIFILRAAVDLAPESTATQPIPIHDSAHDSYVEEGVRRFPTGISGDRFGVETLGSVSSLPEDERTAVRAHAKLPLINTVLRETASDGDIATRIGEYVHNADLADALSHRFGTRAAMTARRDELDSQDHRTAAQERERQALQEILSDDSPEERWARVDADSWTHQDLVTLYDEHLHQDFTPSAVGDYLARLDRATGRELPLTEPIRVVTGLDDIGDLTIDDGTRLGDGEPENLVGALQRERGYLSTALRPDPDGDAEYRLELLIPPGTRGVYVGREGSHPFRNELLLARDTAYRITGVQHDPYGVTTLYARVEPATEPAHEQAPAELPTTTPAFEPGDGETYFGDDLLDQLHRPENGVTDIPRWRIDPVGLEPPLLPADELLENLDAAAREKLLPVIGVPLEVPHATEPGGENRLTLVDHRGQVTPLPGVASVRATYRPETPGWPAGYTFLRNGYSRFVHIDMADGFDFEADAPGSNSGMLRWNFPDGGLRFLGRNRDGNIESSHVPLGYNLVAKAAAWPRRMVKLAGTDSWFEVEIPHSVLPRLPVLADRRTNQLFGMDGLPKPEDVRQGAAGDCALLAHLKARAAHDPESIVEMMNDNRDGTVSVRFTVRDQDQQSARFEWVRVTKDIYVTRGSGIGHFVAHRRGEPLWAGMIEKAFAHRFGKGDGYRALMDGAHAGYVTKFLDKGFYQADPDARQQPVRSLTATDIMNPLGFDVDTLYDLVDDFMPSGRPDLEFVRAIADTYRQWYRERLDVPDYRTPEGFRNYLDIYFPDAWDAEKNALTSYFREAYGGEPENLLLSTRSEVAARAVGSQIDWALRRGTKITIGTRAFGDSSENTTAVPGLVGNHGYAVHGIERDDDDNPIRILLENPHDDEGRYPSPAAGIIYRLDPGGTGYREREDGGIYRREPSHSTSDHDWDVEYGIYAGGTRYRRYQDGVEYGITASQIRYRKDSDGTTYRVHPDSSRYRQDHTGLEYLTEADGTKLRRDPGSDWQPDPNRVDPVRDMTIPPRGLIVAVDLTHLPKFGTFGMSGPGAHAMYPADHPEPKASGTLAAPPAQRPLADTTTQFEPEDGDTYFGEDLLEKLQTALPGTTDVTRPRLDHPGLARPTLADNERLDRLDLRQKQTLLPAPGVKVEMPRATMPDGSDALILVDARGQVHRLPASGAIEATRTIAPDGRPYFTITHPDGTTEDIDRDLARGFRYRPGVDGRPGTLRWNIAGGGVRFLGTDHTGRTGTIDLPNGATLVARPGGSTARWIKHPDSTDWGAVEAPHSVLPELPTLATRHDTPLFGPGGLPRPQEARQGLADSCSLVAAMKHLAEKDPVSLTEALADHGDGTVSVRFMIDGTPEWVRVEKSIYVAPGTDQGQFVGHSPGEPLWASMIDKAYAVRFGKGNGYHGITGGQRAGRTAGLLGKGFGQVHERAIHQPIRNVDTAHLLNPLRFDPDTLHAVVSAALPQGRVADTAFSDEFAETMDDWERELEQRYHSTWQRLHADHPDDPSTRDARWQEFLRTDHLASAEGFRTYLNTLHPGRWQTEKNALAEYYREIHLAQPENRLLPDRYRAGAELLATQIDYALRRNTTVLLATDRFSDARSVAGLFDNHTYSVLGVEYDSGTGKPARLLLENPWDDHDGYPVPQPGIEYRLLPARDDFVIDRTDGRGRFVRAADGTEYVIHPDGAQHRRDPKPYPGAPGRRAVYGLTPRGERYYRDPDGTEYRAYPDGTTTLRTPEGAEYKTTSDGSAFARRDSSAEWSPLPDPLDLWAPVPPRGGLLAVDLAHLPKFTSVGMSGPGAYGLFGPEHSAPAHPLSAVPRPGSDTHAPAAARPFDQPPADHTASLLDGPEDAVLHGLFDEHDDQDTRPVPANWEPVHDDRDPLFAALAKVWRLKGTAEVGELVEAFLDKRYRDERRRRTIADHDRGRGGTDDAQWRAEQRLRLEFDRGLRRERRLLRPRDPGAPPAAHDPGVEAALLRLTSEAVGRNVIGLSSNGRRFEAIGNPDKPLVFVRRAPEGHYEVGLTPTGGLFMASTGDRRMPDYLSSALARVRSEEIPPPLDRMLASPQIPLFAGAAKVRRYIGDDAPIAVGSTLDPVPNPRKFGRPGRMNPVRHMDAEELEAHRVFIGSDRRLYRAVDGRLFDTRAITSSRRGGDGLAMFVMDEFGNMYAADQERDGLHHTSFLGGRTVSAAGEIEVRDGVLVTMTDGSGHYLPRPEVNDYALDWLRRQGLTVSHNFVRRDFAGRPRDRFGELDRQRTEVAHRQILLDAEQEALTRKEHIRTESGTPNSTLPTMREDLARKQSALDQWRAKLASGVIDEALQNQIFAHPAPSGPLDRLIPPESPRGFAESSVPDRATWWRRHGSDWWDALQFQDLAPAYQLGLLTDHPGLRNGEGIPATVRDTLNRKYLQLEIARLSAPGDPETLRPGPQRQLRNLRSMLTDLYAADLDSALAAPESHSGTPVIHLLSFDQDGLGQRATATIAFGPVDTASTVRWHAPANASIGSMSDAITTVTRQHAKPTGVQQDNATVIWVGQDAASATFLPSQLLYGWFSRPDRLGTAVSAFVDAHRTGTTGGALRHLHLHTSENAAKDAAQQLDSYIVTVHSPVAKRSTIPLDGSRPRTRPPGLMPRRAATTGAISRPDISNTTVFSRPDFPARHDTTAGTTRPDPVSDGSAARTRATDQGPLPESGESATATTRIGTTPHDVADVSQFRPKSDRRESAEPVNDCARSAIAELLERTNSPVVTRLAAPEGMSGTARGDLEFAAGTRLTSFEDHTAIADNLRELGDGAVALVVDSYATVDRNGIGAHAYLLVNDNGDIIVVDRGLGAEHGFPPIPRRELSGTEAILYTAQGIPRDFVQHAYGPVHDPANQGHVGEDNVRRFDSDAAGDSFGFHRLNVWHDLPEQVRNALHSYEETQVVNFALRRTTTDDELDRWIEHLRRNTETARLAGRPRGTLPKFAALNDRRNVLSGKQNRNQADDEQLRLLDDILSDPRPEARWDRIVGDARLARVLSMHYELHYDREFDREAVRHEIALLDRAARRRLRLTEPVRIIRALDGIGFMTIDEHGTPLGDADPRLLLNVVQQDHGYMSTSVSAAMVHLAKGSTHRMELVVPPGAHGVYLGNDATNPEQHELVLARDTRYRITGIGSDDDITVLYAEVLPPPPSDEPARDESRIGQGEP